MLIRILESSNNTDPDIRNWQTSDLFMLHLPDLAGLVVEPAVLLIRLRVLVLGPLVLLEVDGEELAEGNAGQDADTRGQGQHQPHHHSSKVHSCIIKIIVLNVYVLAEVQ